MINVPAEKAAEEGSASGQSQNEPRLVGFCGAEALQCVEHQGAVQHQGELGQDALGAFWNFPCIPQEEAAVILLSGTGFGHT